MNAQFGRNKRYVFLKIDFFFLMVKVTVQHFAFLIYDTKSEMKYPLTEAVVVFQ